jgi:tRNA dimethylallyltransferase
MFPQLADRFDRLDTDWPVLIAGPTASGKSSLALRIAREQGRAVVNADALQVFGCWRVLTARPDPAEEALAPHHLYGHVPHDAAYSVGDWLREVAPLLALRPAPVVVGGTGLYLSALTEGLADIPRTDPVVRAAADRLRAASGLDALVRDLDLLTRSRIDLANPMRVQRAWEVQQQTGRGLAEWQAATGAPLVDAARAHLVHLLAPVDWLSPRIDRRLAAMLDGGALDEVRAMVPLWNPSLPSAKAIGAAEFHAALRGVMPLSEALALAQVATRQYAKRQRTWFRRRMAGWTALDAETLGG